jgi:adenylylsulfate kinase
MVSESEGEGIYLLDFICPTQELRNTLGADVVIWMDTVRRSKYPDTDRLFEEPKNPDLIINCFWEDSVKKAHKLIDAVRRRTWTKIKKKGI